MLACVALAGGGTTLAAEMHIARQPGKPAEAAAATRQTPTPTPMATSVTPVATVVVAPALASAKHPTRVAERRAKPAKKAKSHRKAAQPARPAKPEKAVKFPKPFTAHQPVKAKLGNSIAKAQKQVGKVRNHVAKAHAKQVAKAEAKQVAKAEKQVAKADKQGVKAEKQVAKAEAKQDAEAKPDKKPR